jgi:hypothetical protein
VGGALLATSPDTIWWSGAIAMALTGAGFLWLGDRIPDPFRKASRSGITTLEEVHP